MVWKYNRKNNVWIWQYVFDYQKIEKLLNDLIKFVNQSQNNQENEKELSRMEGNEIIKLLNASFTNKFPFASFYNALQAKNTNLFERIRNIIVDMLACDVKTQEYIYDFPSSLLAHTVESYEIFKIIRDKLYEKCGVDSGQSSGHRGEHSEGYQHTFGHGSGSGYNQASILGDYFSGHQQNFGGEYMDKPEN
uniref:Uncharacterized protein n=1 Tax=Meloidogyne javanica TaxID=6303 RepID=A0A915MNG1_MELJA